mgnify:CR=1 FL=1
MKRYLFIALVLASGVGFFGATESTVAVTRDAYAQIQELIERISLLQKQLNVLRGQQPLSPVQPVTPPATRCASVTRNLNIGSRGDDVRGLQAFLRSSGHFSGTDTGYYGSATSRAVASWQTSQNIPAIGTIGPISRRALATACGQDPLPDIDVTTCPGSLTVGVGRNGEVLCGPVEHPQPPINYPLPDYSYSSEGPLTVHTFQYSDHLIVNVTVTLPKHTDYTIDFGDGTKEKGNSGNCREERQVHCAVNELSHVYIKLGTYTMKLLTKAGVVLDEATIVVKGDASTECTKYIGSVCGQPSGCVDTCKGAQICNLMCQFYPPKTYSNRCNLTIAGAQFLHMGVCTATSYEDYGIPK